MIDRPARRRAAANGGGLREKFFLVELESNFGAEGAGVNFGEVPERRALEEMVRISTASSEQGPLPWSHFWNPATFPKKRDSTMPTRERCRDLFE